MRPLPLPPPPLAEPRLTSVCRSSKLGARACSPTRRRRRACTAMAGQRTTTREGAAVAASSSRLLPCSACLPPSPSPSPRAPLRPHTTCPRAGPYSIPQLTQTCYPLHLKRRCSVSLEDNLWSASASLTCTNCTRRARSFAPSLAPSSSLLSVLAGDPSSRGCLPRARRSVVVD